MDDTLQRISDILQPIANREWDGKWRILKAIERMDALEQENEQLKHDMERYMVIATAEINSNKHSSDAHNECSAMPGCTNPAHRTKTSDDVVLSAPHSKERD